MVVIVAPAPELSHDCTARIKRHGLHQVLMRLLVKPGPVQDFPGAEIKARVGRLPANPGFQLLYQLTQSADTNGTARIRANAHHQSPPGKIL